ncbi:MAG: AmmeMemoRadiSam system protein B [Candidatus Binatia bacterium]
MAHVRSPAVAGSFYPSDPRELRKLIDHCFVSSPLGPKGATERDPSLIGGMVPHAGYIYSGPCAAHLYARLDPNVDCVVLLGVNHRGRGYRAALSPYDYWETPLGKIKVDSELNDALKSRVAFLKDDETAHVQEHSLEVQLPFLQRVAGDFAFLPIALSDVTLAECSELGQALAENCTSPRQTILLASTDLSHYLSARETERLDRLALDAVLRMQPAELLSIVEKENITMCGVLPTAVLLYALKALGAKEAYLLKHCHSGDVTPMTDVVGYASVAFQL